jgi:hypothetical protein
MSHEPNHDWSPDQRAKVVHVESLLSARRASSTPSPAAVSPALPPDAHPLEHTAVGDPIRIRDWAGLALVCLYVLAIDAFVAAIGALLLATIH